MKNHLKRIVVPRTWKINRKESIFSLRPNPGAHSLEMGLPLGIIIRDILGLASAMSEVKKILHNNEVLVDGKRRKDHRFIVGLFDVLIIPKLKKSYRVILDQKGRLDILEVSDQESLRKVCKIIGKKVLVKGKVQFNLHDGKNIIIEQQAKVGDSLVVGLPKLEVKEVLPLQPGATILLIHGKHGGDVGKLKEIKGKEAVCVRDGQEILTVKRNLFVIGGKEAVVKVREEIKAEK